MRIQIYFPEERYLLVLAYRQGQDGDAYLLPWTAYPVAQEREIKLPSITRSTIPKKLSGQPSHKKARLRFARRRARL